MGGFCRAGSQTSTSTKQTSFAPYIEEMIKNQLMRANQLSEQPYQPYQMPRIADFTQDQQDYFSGIRGLQGKGLDQIDAAVGRMEEAAQYKPEKFTDVAQDYMNPYLDNVLDRQQKRMFRSDDIARKGRDARAIEAGAFGGDRQAIQESEAQKNLQDRMADQEAQAMSQAYQTGANIFASDANRGMQNQQNLMAANKGIAGLVGQGQGLAQNQLGMLGGMGSQQQGMNQAGLDLMYQDYQNQQQYPYQQMGFLSNMLQGTPMGQTTTMTGTTPTPSMGQQLAGLGITGLGIAGAGGYFDPGGFSMGNLFR